MKNHFKILCGAVAFVVAGQVSAAAEWTLTSNGTTTANSFSKTATDVVNGATATATATGWADTGPKSSNSTAAGALAQQTSGYFYDYGSNGLGINNFDGCQAGGSSQNPTSCTGDTGDLASTAPEHALDNNGRYEMVLLDFGSALVNLTSAKFGWVGTGKTTKLDGQSTTWDSDYSVMAYTPTNSSTSDLTGKTWADIGAAGSGWTMIGSYANGTTSAQGNAFANGIYSSLWLIGPYNPIAGEHYTLGNDALKLASVTGAICSGGSGSGCTTTTTTSQVPEPGSMALFGIALLGLFGLRKRQKS